MARAALLANLSRAQVASPDLGSCSCSHPQTRLGRAGAQAELLPTTQTPWAAMKAAAAGAAALACGNASCGKALVPPLLQCSKCKADLLLQGLPGSPAPMRSVRCAR